MESAEQGDKKGVMEDICDDKDDVDNLNSDQLNSRPVDTNNLRVEKPKPPFQENMCPVNIYSSHCDRDSLLLLW